MILLQKLMVGVEIIPEAGLGWKSLEHESSKPEFSSSKESHEKSREKPSLNY
jgi:hypothetical protein